MYVRKRGEELFTKDYVWGDVAWDSGTSKPSCFSLGSVSPSENSRGGGGRGLCFLLPGSSAEIPLFLLPVLRWVFLVFSAFLAQFVVAMLVVVLVVVMVSSHSVGPSGFGADNLGPVPLAIAPAPDDGHVALGKSFITLVAYSGMHIIFGLSGTNGRGVLHCWRGSTQHCALLTDVGEVVVAGNIVPAPTLMRHHHHTVLPTREEIVRLVLSPVLILQPRVVRPLEIPLHDPVVQADPRVFTPEAVNEAMFLR